MLELDLLLEPVDCSNQAFGAQGERECSFVLPKTNIGSVLHLYFGHSSLEAILAKSFL